MRARWYDWVGFVVAVFVGNVVIQLLTDDPWQVLLVVMWSVVTVVAFYVLAARRGRSPIGPKT
jgi:membrane protein implicated in regulation of membrane protease activity